VVSVVEAKDLVGPDSSGIVDTYVRVYLLPDKTTNMQTRVSVPIESEGSQPRLQSFLTFSYILFI
jgi:hypothetical protein